MKFFLFSILVTVLPLVVSACPGPQSERAQDSDATLKFVGTVTDYRIHDVKNHALLKFSVSKTLRGETNRTWSLYYRSESLPANLTDFRKRFGHVIEVGARKMIAPGEISDSLKKALYVVDAACSMNGENYLLKRIE